MTMPPDNKAHAAEHSFTIECGRLIVNRAEFVLRSVALRLGLDIDLEIRKGLIDCYIYGKITGSPDAIANWKAQIRRALPNGE